MAPAIQVGSGRYRRNFLEAIDACLKVKPSQRPRSVRAGAANAARRKREQRIRPTRHEPQTIARATRRSPGAPSRSGSASRQWFATCAGVATVLAAAYLGYEYTRLPPAGSGATSIVNRDGETDMTAKRRAEQAADLRRKEIEQEQLKRQAALDAERRLKGSGGNPPDDRLSLKLKSAARPNSLRNARVFPKNSSSTARCARSWCLFGAANI